MGKRLLVLVAMLGCLLGGAVPEVADAATWCGADQVPTERPDTLGGPKFHVIYAVPADGADRFAEMASKIATDVNVVLSWWAREDPARVPRFDLAAFPGCGSAVGALDISFVRLAQPAAAFHFFQTRLPALARAIEGAFADRSKKYLVVYDGAVAAENVCGSAYGPGDPSGGGANAVGAIYIQNAPWMPGCGLFGIESYNAKTIAHELLHMIGAVPEGAPHGCDGHVCDQTNDVMYGGVGCCERLGDYVLDVGRDDYYGHSSPWWDAQDSRWLSQAPDRTIAVSLAGARADDTVSSAQTGIDCPRVCSLPWAGGETVVLTPSVGAKTRFVRWAGDCSGTGSCSVLTDADRRVTAVFGPASYPFTVVVSGRGTVTSNRLSACRRLCRSTVAADASVALRAKAAKGWRFAGWRQSCAPAKARLSCSIRASAARSVTAVFRRR